MRSKHLRRLIKTTYSTRKTLSLLTTMEDSSSSSTSHGSGTPFSYPSSFHELVRAVLRCLGLQTGFHQSPISCPKQEGDDDGKVDNNQHVSQKEDGSAPSPTTGCLDPPSTVVDPPADPPSTTATGDDGVPFIALFTPKRPGTGGGRGPQIN